MSFSILLVLFFFFFLGVHSFFSNDTDGATIQQAVWRPTGTQLGKKKSNKDSAKNDKVTPKKKNPPRKVRARDIYVGDGAPVENLKQTNEQQDFGFAQQNIPQEQTNDIQNTTQTLPDNQTEFNGGLTMNQQPQPMYQHPSMNITQNNWPLDLVQGSHHYPQVCTLCLCGYLNFYIILKRISLRVKHFFVISYIRVNQPQ